MLQKKMPRQTQTSNYPQVGRLPEKQPRVRTFQTRNNEFGQQLKHCSKFLQKKWTGFEIDANRCNSLQKNEMDCWIVVKTKANIETKSVETMVETSWQLL